MLRGHQRQQLTDATGFGQRFMAEMVIHVELLVFHPLVLAEAAGQTLVEGRFRRGILADRARQLADVLGAGALRK